MRIVAGSRKGARLVAPKGLATRPTSDRVREAVFQLLRPLDGARVLDLFAGSGALGLEALSRGAASATLVESARDALRAIERNVEKLALEGALVVRADAVRFVVASRARYDVVFVDPPYEMVESLRMTLARDLPRVLAPGAAVVYETAAGDVPDVPLRQRTTRRYGSTQVTIFDAEERR